MSAFENEPKHLRLSPFVPYDPMAEIYVKKEGHQSLPPSANSMQPFEYSGWMKESLSWHETCYIHAGLNPTAYLRVRGKDALAFFESLFVNSFKNFPIGTGKHAIACNDKGQIITHGLMLRHGEEEFTVFSMILLLEYALSKTKLTDITFESRVEKMFVFQLGGPRTLEVIEAAAKEDLHDIKFIHFRGSSIEGRDVDIVRMGMCGTLAYEVHGKTEDAKAVYNALLNAGESFGICKLGRHAYRNVHTEAGFPQLNLNFPNARDEGYLNFLAGREIKTVGSGKLSGSLGTDINLRFLTPLETGWTKMIKFDHEFPGRKALEEAFANPKRQMVTLVWNVDDILDVKRSQYMPGEPYMPMDDAEDYSYSIGAYDLHADLVLKNGKPVGLSTGRQFTPYYRQMISMGVINTELCEPGTEVTVLWGDPGTRQKEIRAIVSRYPYIHENRNEHVDVKMIPRPKL